MEPASLLTETCHNVATEPPLHPLNGETLGARSANTDDNARLDIRARGFWNNHRDGFFDVRVFYPNAPCNHSTDAYRRHEMAKKREYGQRVREVERGVFTPLVLSTNGGMGKEAATFYRRLADMIAQKRQNLPQIDYVLLKQVYSIQSSQPNTKEASSVLSNASTSL